DAPGRLGVEMRAADQPEERRRLVQVRNHGAGGETRAVAELDAGGTPVLDHDGTHGRLRPDLTALVGDRATERLREHAHATLHAPHEPAALVLRERVDQAERAAGRERAL